MKFLFSFVLLFSLFLIIQCQYDADETNIDSPEATYQPETSESDEPIGFCPPSALSWKWEVDLMATFSVNGNPLNITGTGIRWQDHESLRIDNRYDKIDLGGHEYPPFDFTKVLHTNETGNMAMKYVHYPTRFHCDWADYIATDMTHDECLQQCAYVKTDEVIGEKAYVYTCTLKNETTAIWWWRADRDDVAWPLRVELYLGYATEIWESKMADDFEIKAGFHADLFEIPNCENGIIPSQHSSYWHDFTSEGSDDEIAFFVDHQGLGVWILLGSTFFISTSICWFKTLRGRTPKDKMKTLFGMIEKKKSRLSHV